MALLRPYLPLLGASLAFAVMPVFTRESGAPILGVAAWRAILVALSFLLWASFDGGVRGGAQGLEDGARTPGSLRAAIGNREVLRHGLWQGLALALSSSTFVGAYALTTVANTIFFHALAPLAVFPLAWWLFRERPSGAALAGTAIAVTGVGLLSGVSIFHLAAFTNPRFLLGDFLALLSAVGYGTVLVATRASRQAALPVLPVLFVAWSVAAVVLTIVALLFGTLSIPLSAFPWVLGLALLCTTLPFYLLNVALTTIPAGMASLVAMSEVVFATLVGLVVYGEAPAPIGWIGGGLLVLGIAHPLLWGEAKADGLEVEADDPARLGRLGARLLLLNGAALLVLIGGEDSAAGLAWAALASILRLGRAPLLGVGGRYAGLIRVGMVGLGGCLLGGLILGRSDAPISASVALVGAGALLADAWLASLEKAAVVSGGGRDPDALPQLALGLMVLSGVLSLAAHPLANVLPLVATVALGGAALSVVLAGVSGSSSGLDRLPLSPRVWIAAGALLLLAGGIRTVPAGHRAIIERFGYPLPEPAPPGLLIRLPPPLEAVTLVDVASVRTLRIAAADGALLCGDQTLVSMDAALLWTVSDPAAFLLKNDDPAEALAAVARSALLETLAHLAADDVLSGDRSLVEKAVAERTGVLASSLGVAVAAVQLTRVGVPAPVQSSFLEVVSAEEHKRKLQNEAEAYAATVVPKARGTAAAKVEAAKGVALQRRAGAEGDAAWIEGVAKAGASALTRERLWRREIPKILGEREKVLVPDGVRVVVGAGTVVPLEVQKK